MDNCSVEDAEMFSLARDSIAIGHEAGYGAVLSRLPPSRQVRIFGKPLISVDYYRKGECLCRGVRLFGRLKILGVRMSAYLRMRLLLAPLFR